MAQLIRSGVLRYANADLVEKARLASELAGELMAWREGDNGKSSLRFLSNALA